MELKELKKNLNKLDTDGFWMLKVDKEQIYPLILNGALGTHSKDGIWMWVWMNKRVGVKQRIKEFITVLNIKINNEEKSK
jgi:hypothetical protein